MLDSARHWKIHNVDPTQRIEIRKTRVREIKFNLKAKEYKRLYLTISTPRNSYSTTKLDKISENEIFDDLPIRKIVYDIYYLSSLSQVPSRRTSIKITKTHNQAAGLFNYRIKNNPKTFII